MNAHLIEGYYNRNGKLYRVNGDSEAIQDQKRKATVAVMALINQNEAARAQVNEWSQNATQNSQMAAYVVTAITLDTVTDPWFWIAMHVMTRPTHFGAIGGGGCNCCSINDLSCSGGSGSSDSCCILALIVAIGILVAAVVATVWATVSHASDAEEARKSVDEIKEMMLDEQAQEVQHVFNRILSMQRGEWASHSLKTVFTAVGAGGATLLTATAIIALIAVIEGVPVPSYASLIALYGGGMAGGALAAHAFRAIYLEVRKSRDLELLRQLYNDALQLGSVHPFEILAEQNQENATLLFGGHTFIKQGQIFTKEDGDTHALFQNARHFILPYNPQNN